MAGELNFYLKDLYPNMGYTTTGLTTVPDAEDQNSMVDNQDTATKLTIQQDPISAKQIMIFMAVILGVVILFSIV